MAFAPVLPEGLAASVRQVLARHPEVQLAPVFGSRARDVAQPDALALQACTDIASHLIADLGWPLAKDLGDSFRRLHDQGVIHRGTADAVVRATGLRDVVGHVYARADPEPVFEAGGGRRERLSGRPSAMGELRKILAVPLVLAATVVGCATGHVGSTAPDPADRAGSLGACHAEAVGAEVLRTLDGLTYRLEIVEPEFSVEALYRTHRAGSVRVDVSMNGERVMSEGWDASGGGWMLPQGAEEPSPASAEGEANLRHGFELPGRLWTFADLEARGHEVVSEGTEPRDGNEYPVLRVELADGHRAWYLLDPDTCLVARSRDFRSFHPDMGTETAWIETVYGDYREVDGVLFPHEIRNVDVETGEILARTQVLEIETESGADS